jgi:pyridoxal phosphate enzyme (YggS family)
MATLHDRITAVHTRIDTACAQAHRQPSEVGLICVSKTQPAQAVRDAHALGERHFGENYVQEAIDKIDQLGDLRTDLTWHFIGPLQSNKSRTVAEAFDWVHTVDSLKLARRLSDQRPPQLPPLQVCVQVNIDDEASKSGLRPAEALDLVGEIAQLPRLQLRGLMSIPAPHAEPAQQRQAHVALATLLQQANAQHRLSMDTLSMGMSDDLEPAIAAGATWVRIGTAVFGARSPKA